MSEVAIHRRNTTAFIAADPVTLVFEHYKKEQTPGGGYKIVADGSVSLRVRLIPATESGEQVDTTSGKTIKLVYTVLAEWNADVRQRDRFTRDGEEYVLDLPISPEHTDRAYFRKGWAVRRSDV